MKKDINKIIKNCKKLIDMPYNQLNLDNYQQKIKEAYNIDLTFFNSEKQSPTKLMSGQHPKAGRIGTYITNKEFDKHKKHIYLIGKGVLFDAGGYDLKHNMLNMKSDMAGLAISFAVQSYLEQNVIAYCPVATNFIHNNQITPGDYIKIGKKTVEITNTDAEGRLILVEALDNLNQKSNDIIITIATLTGVAELAVGSKATAVFSDNVDLSVKYLNASEKEKEYAWRLPMWDYLQKEFNKKRIKNCSKIKPGTSMGAMFIKQFIKYPNNWIHLDIAPSAFDSNKRKATGIPIKSLIRFIKGII